MTTVPTYAHSATRSTNTDLSAVVHAPAARKSPRRMFAPIFADRLRRLRRRLSQDSLAIVSSLAGSVSSPSSEVTAILAPLQYIFHESQGSLRVVPTDFEHDAEQHHYREALPTLRIYRQSAKVAPFIGFTWESWWICPRHSNSQSQSRERSFKRLCFLSLIDYHRTGMSKQNPPPIKRNQGPPQLVHSSVHPISGRVKSKEI